MSPKGNEWNLSSTIERWLTQPPRSFIACPIQGFWGGAEASLEFLTTLLSDESSGLRAKH